MDSITTYKSVLYYHILKCTWMVPTQNKFDDMLFILQIIERAALDHPHHTLLCVLALAHAKKDAEIINPPSNRRSKLTKSTSDPNKDEVNMKTAMQLTAFVISFPIFAKC